MQNERHSEQQKVGSKIESLFTQAIQNERHSEEKKSIQETHNERHSEEQKSVQK